MFGHSPNGRDVFRQSPNPNGATHVFGQNPNGPDDFACDPGKHD